MTEEEKVFQIKKILESKAKEGTWEDAQKVLHVVLETRDKAYKDAIVNLARYKFNNYGYFCARWVTLNHQLKGTPYHSKTNPFKKFVELAREILKEEEQDV
tara:strand:+ start:7537 stop:7839 length:303 start_codon:yes stop_codon:yes gene_type:complete